ncbi:hypothetical protein PVAND_015957 [Polypedilum vanderplanki]|uniref:F-box domain-containing protein n=1 Tax=Polypedilum vanderplanki TaxID=319348 RepID=A0A9J6BEH6_POLVA|nr:hypothetical protein PVAND_015957 [Polypedilum vanderplanki]
MSTFKSSWFKDFKFTTNEQTQPKIEQTAPIFSLPNELLFDIFDYLDSKSSQSISKTCKRFNTLINDTPKLLERLKVQLNSNKIGNDWIGSRKYSTIYIDGSAAIFFFDIFIEIGENISHLYLNGNGMEMKVLKKILLLMPNLTVLSLGCDDEEVISEPVDLIEPLPERFFRIFEFSGTNQNFKIFLNCQAKVFKLTRDYKDKTVNDENFKKFLKKQTKLESLLLGNFEKESSMFSDRTLNEVQFKLKTLRFYQFEAYELPNFKLFIDNFKESLTYLELDLTDCTVLEDFREFPNLKTVSLIKMFYLELEAPMNFVEDLIIENVKVPLAESFPNITRMTILDYLKKPSQVKNFKKLEFLEISSIDVAELKIPTVKKLRFCGTSFLCPHPFKFDGNQIKELMIEEVEEIEWLNEYLERQDTKLKLLELKGVFINAKLQKTIEQNKQKIEQLVIMRCDLEVEKFIVRKDINLTFYEISIQ